jgi:hypothetical protein
VHRSPIAGGGKLVQLVKALLVMRVRRRGHDRRLVGQFAGGDHRQNRLEDGFLLLWWDGQGVTKLCFPQPTDKSNKF